MITEGDPAEVVALHEERTAAARARTAEEARAAGVDPRIVKVR